MLCWNTARLAEARLDRRDKAEPQGALQAYSRGFNIMAAYLVYGAHTCVLRIREYAKASNNLW